MKIARILTISVLVISVFLVGSAKATDCWLNLPPDPVTMVVHDGTISYFDTTLSDVPSGYDVTNRTYLGWCVDIRYDIPRGTDFSVMLYSSCAPPAGLEGERWDMINYILNHKQGEMWDIQHAIWYFMKWPDGVPEAEWRSGYTPTAAAMAIVDDAVANGAGFVPGPGEVVAVICYPEVATQISIIELTCAPPGAGKVTGGGQIELFPEGKGSFGFNVMSEEGDLAPKGELQYVDHATNMKVHCHDMTFLDVSPDKTWAYFEGECTIDGVGGFSFTAYVEDNGEPGKSDVFEITLSSGYSAGGTLLNGNIQIHKKP